MNCRTLSQNPHTRGKSHHQTTCNARLPSCREMKLLSKWSKWEEETPLRSLADCCPLKSVGYQLRSVSSVRATGWRMAHCGRLWFAIFLPVTQGFISDWQATTHTARGRSTTILSRILCLQSVPNLMPYLDGDDFVSLFVCFLTLPFCVIFMWSEFSKCTFLFSLTAARDSSWKKSETKFPKWTFVVFVCFCLVWLNGTKFPKWTFVVLFVFVWFGSMRQSSQNELLWFCLVLFGLAQWDKVPKMDFCGFVCLFFVFLLVWLNETEFPKWTLVVLFAFVWFGSMRQSSQNEL